MSLACRILWMKHVCLLGCAALFAAALANAQSAANQSPNSTSNSGWSSSQAGAQQLAEDSAPANPAGPAAGASALPAAPAARQDQNSDNYSGWHGHDLVHRLTWEAGGGFNAPIGNDTGNGPGFPVITWGGNFTLGAGLRFSKRVSALFEYQFMDDKLPGAFIASVNSGNTSGTPITAGDAHINSFTGSPFIDLTPKRSNGGYLVGGWGFYHKSTNFNGYECCEYSYYGEYPVSVTLASFTSNQWGANAGFGLYHRVGSMYGESHTLIFAEARYTFIHTPPLGVYNSAGTLVSGQANGLGTTELIPVTIGVRF